MNDPAASGGVSTTEILPGSRRKRRGMYPQGIQQYKNAGRSSEMENREERILQDGIEELRQTLPSGWTVTLEPKAAESAQDDRRLRLVDGYIRIDAPDRKSALIAVEVKSRPNPRAVIDVVSQLRILSLNAPLLMIAPFLSPAVRERLREASIAFVDLTGNVRLELREPGLFIATQGADKNPEPEERPLRSLRGAKAGKIVRALLDAKEPPGVREFATQADINPGYISRVFTLLDREGLIDRRGRGRIARVDWPRLLRRWAEDAPLTSRGKQATYLEPRGLAALLSRLKQLDIRYAITGTLAAARFAPIVSPRLATVYTEDAKRAASVLGLRPAETGANVILIEPNDYSVFEGTLRQDDLLFVPPSLAAADLLSSVGRGPSEAEELIAWMSKNEDAWRG